FRPFLPKIVEYAHPNSTWEAHDIHAHSLPQPVIDSLTEAVLNQLEGHWRSNSYIAALCPFPHQRDRPGMHFSYHVESGWGHCFGKHGKISPGDLCQLLKVSIEDHSAVSVA